MKHRTPVAIGPTSGGRAVEIAIRALHQPRIGSMAVGSHTAELIERREGACGGDLKHRAIAIRPPKGSCAVKITVRALHQSCEGTVPIAGQPTELVERGQGARRSDLEYRAKRIRATG